MGLFGIFWIALSALGLAAGVRHVARMRAVRRREQAGVPEVNDDALRQILETGRLRGPSHGKADMRRAAAAEEDFWEESWDEPEEFGR